MIITCPCEKIQFKIDSSLIPNEGRELQCGSCEKVWFYKPQNESEAPLKLNNNISENKTKHNHCGFYSEVTMAFSRASTMFLPIFTTAFMKFGR